MKVVNGINNLLESKALAASVFGVTGISRLASDYKNAPDDKKNFTLAHDAIVLGASALGVTAYGLLSKKAVKSKPVTRAITTVKSGIHEILKDKPYYKKVASTLKHASEIPKRCFDNTMMLGSGILGAIGADYAIHTARLDKKIQSKPTNKTESESFNKIYDTKRNLVNRFNSSELNKTLENTVGSEVTSNMYSRVFDFPAMKMFTTSMVGMQGFEVIEEKTLKSRMKHATKCLIANSVVPVFFLSTASTLTRNLNNAIRLPLTFATMIYGTMYTNKFIENHQYKNVRKPDKTTTS